MLNLEKMQRLLHKEGRMKPAPTINKSLTLKRCVTPPILTSSETLTMKIYGMKFFLEILKETDKLYVRQIPSYYNPDTTDIFWDVLETELFELISKAFHNLKEKYFESFKSTKALSSRLIQLIVIQQKETLLKRAKELKNNILFMMNLKALCEKYHCEILTCFNQRYHPRFFLTKGECVGIIFDWGSQLLKNPPSSLTSPNEEMRSFMKCLSCLEHEKFPNNLHAHYAFLGESYINKNTEQFQQDQIALLNICGRSQIKGNRLDGNALVAGVLKLFSEKEHEQYETKQSEYLTQGKGNVRVIEATLFNPSTINKTATHMIGIAKISFHHSFILRFFDPDTGEFECTDPKQFGLWLQAYFALNNDHQRFTHFTLRYINPGLEHIIKQQGDSVLETFTPVQFKRSISAPAAFSERVATIYASDIQKVPSTSAYAARFS